MEKDIQAIHSYVIKMMIELVAELEFWTSNSFVELRNKVLTRLAEEEERLPNWKAGENNTWIDNQRLQKLD